MKTAMNVTTKETKDDVALFTDGEEVPAEIPAMLSIGSERKIRIIKTTVQVSIIILIMRLNMVRKMQQESL